MDAERYTDRAKGFIQSAQSLATREGNQQFTSLHLLKVFLDDNEGLAAGLIDRAGGNSKAILDETEAALAKWPNRPSRHQRMGHQPAATPTFASQPCIPDN